MRECSVNRVKMPKRARRRHDRWRMVERAKRLIQSWDANLPRLPYAHIKPRPAHDAQRFADNLAYCACLACRQSRRDHGRPNLERTTLLR